MPEQILKQPNGKYALWTSVVDDFIAYDCTRQEIIRLYARRAASRAREDIKYILESIDKGEKPYGEFTESWKQLLRTRRSVHRHETGFHEIKVVEKEKTKRKKGG